MGQRLPTARRTVQPRDLATQRHTNSPGVRQRSGGECGCDVRGHAGTQSVRQTRPGVLFVNDDRDASFAGSQIGRRRYVPAKAHHDVRGCFVDGCTSRMNSRLERGGQAYQRTSGSTREGHLGNGSQVVPAGRYQPLFETFLGAQSSHPHMRVPAAKAVRESQQRRHVPSRTATGQEHRGQSRASGHDLRPRRVAMTASERRTTPGRAARASRQPGSLRANDSNIPKANRVAIKADPPLETKGSGTPMTGNSPITEPMLMAAWARIQTITPPVATRTKKSSLRRTSR